MEILFLLIAAAVTYRIHRYELSKKREDLRQAVREHFAREGGEEIIF